jgi:hypothetical protein
MTKTKLFCYLFLFILAATAYAFTPNDAGFNRTIGIPYYDDQPVYLASLVVLSKGDPGWADFNTRHGHWTGNVNSRTGLVHRAWGGAIPVGIPSSEQNAGILALSFLQSESEFLQINLNELELVSSRYRGHHWFVTFKQVHGGLDVYGSLITIRISNRGNIVHFGCDYYPQIELPIIPALSGTDATLAAERDIFSTTITRISEPALMIFPMPEESGFVYKLAYSVDISTDEPARWTTIVDANTGELLYRKNDLYFLTVDGYISGQIYPATPFDSLVSRPLEYENLTVMGPGDLVTDPNGFFSGLVSDLLYHSLTTAFTGSFVRVVNNQGSNASHIDSVQTGDTLYFEWQASNSRNDERNSFYHVNVVHDFIKAIDPAFIDLDMATTCNVNENSTCNAFWDGSSVNFFMAGGGCSNTGEIADVIYHEYGHGITDYQYRPNGSPSGAQHEGWSDFTAATITNQPLIGRGFYSGNPDGYLRTVDNTNHYPEDWQGESHNDGLIISGALWDLREALDPRTGYCDSLFHFARYGLSGNFQDYLVDMILYDDDDDNLFNLTPNWHAIMDNFALHGIYPLDQMNISHILQNDVPDMPDPIPVTAVITSTFTPYNMDSMFVYYRTDRTGSFQEIPLDSTGNQDEFSALIPAQPRGTMVEYYFSVTDISGRTTKSPSTAPIPTYFFVIGELTTQFADSLERASGWTVGAAGDDATTGRWERVDPLGTWADGDPTFPYQPDDDHTPDPGIYCYITGQQPAGNPDNGANDVDGGKTSLTSANRTIAGYENAIVEYYRWFVSNRNVDDTFLVLISGDNGSTWNTLELVTNTENFWKKSRFLISQILPQANQIRLRFSAADEGSGSIVEGGVDDFTIYSFSATGIDHDSQGDIPETFALMGNYPNPFNGRTEIRFNLPEISDVEFSVFDITGRKVYGQSYANLDAGYHSIIWDSRAADGTDFASGIYFYKIQTKYCRASEKMLLLK